MQISGYELIRVDHPRNQKRGGICIYHKDFLPIELNNVSCLKECLNFSLSVYWKQCNITLIYRSPSQSSEVFDTFLSNFEFLLDITNRNPFVSIILKQGQTIGVLVIKQLMKAKNLNPGLPNVDLNW